VATSKILSIRLQNFQSHKDTTVLLSKGVTVLAGESSNGKTAVLRALRWVLTNRPTGIGFVSHWAKKVNAKGEQVLDGTCSVTLEVLDADGKVNTVSRVRSATSNAYVLNGETLEAVGTDVPPAVLKLLGLKEVNTQSQDDPYFLLTLPAGQVAARLNELVHLDDIDKAFGFLHRRKVEANVLLKEDAVDSVEQRRIIDNLKHIPQCEEDFKEIEALQNKSDELEDRKNGMKELIAQVMDCNRQMAMYQLDVPSENIPRMQDMLSDREDLLNELEALSKLDDAICDAEAALSRLGASIEFNAQELQELVDKWRELNDRYGELIDLQKLFNSNTADLKLNEKELNEAQKQLPETCPLCGNPIGENHDNCCG